MIPKAQLPFLKPLPEQVKRAKMIKKKRKLSSKLLSKKFRTAKALSRKTLTNQAKNMLKGTRSDKLIKKSSKGLYKLD